MGGVSSARAGSASNFDYDANGNLNGQGTNTYAYDSANRLVQRGTTASLTNYTYDGAGGLLKRVDPDGTSTTYVGGIFEKKTDGTGTTITKYYGALGRNVAKRVRGPGQASNVAVSYVLADHLGSTVGMLDGAGALVSGSKTAYWPFGAVRSGGSALGDKLYTGQQKESDDGLGLYDYGARFYSTTLGRFAAVDPIIGSASDPQSWNAYSYVRNNPLSYVDPTGMDPASDWVHSGSIGQERDTGCGPTCEALIALDSVGLHSADEVAAYQHEQLVGALLLLSAEASLTEQWTTSNSIANGGGSDCDTACQWMAAARGYQDAAEKQHEDLVAALWFLSESISKQRSANCESCVWIVTGVTESGTQARPVYAYPVTDPVSSYVESRLNELRDPATIATLVMLVASGGESGIEPEGLEPEFEEPPVRNANEPQRRPGSAGESKGTDALRAHNQRLQDAARDAGLTRQQTRRFHEDYDSRDPDMSYADLVKAAQMYRYGN